MVEIAAIVLAAGRASRYREAGGEEATKLVADYHGEPLVRWAARAALESRARPVIVVTGHAKAEVETALAGLEVHFAHNPNFASGLASSLRTGIAALPPEAAGAVVLLGDMPDAGASIVEALIDGFVPAREAYAATPLFDGARGNPVLLGRALFHDVARLQGDEGARSLLRGMPAERIVTVEVGHAGVMRDIDRPADLIEAIGARRSTAKRIGLRRDP
jgi:molybdenum cofactor cytidylyltransferase